MKQDITVCVLFYNHFCRPYLYIIRVKSAFPRGGSTKVAKHTWRRSIAKDYDVTLSRCFVNCSPLCVLLLIWICLCYLIKLMICLCYLIKLIIRQLFLNVNTTTVVLYSPCLMYIILVPNLIRHYQDYLRIIKETIATLPDNCNNEAVLIHVIRQLSKPFKITYKPTCFKEITFGNRFYNIYRVNYQ